MKNIFFGKNTSKDLDAISKLKRKKKPIVILPIGAVEAHGEHLPVWTDTIIPYKLAKKLAFKTNSLVLPPLHYGFSYTLRPWKGTISLRSHTLALVIEDVIRELVRNGFDRILILNGHGGNESIISSVLKELCYEIKFKICVVSWWKLVDLGSVGHADENEASLVMSLTGWKKRKSIQTELKKYVGKVFPTPNKLFSRYGYCGKVGGESVKKGKKIEEAILKKLIALLNNDLLLEE